MADQGPAPARLKKPNYTQIPNIILDNLHLFEPQDWGVLLHICRRTFGWARDKRSIKIGTIAKKTRLSETSVKVSLRRLVKQGYVIKQINFSADNGSQLANTYSLNIEIIPKRAKTPPAEYSPPSPGCIQPPPEAVNGMDPRLESADLLKESFSCIESLLRNGASATTEELSSLPASPLSDQNQTSKPNALQDTEETPDTETPPQSPSPQPDNTEKLSFSGYELRDDLDVAAFVEWMYKAKGREIDATGKFVRGKLTTRANTPIRTKLEEKESYHGTEAFREALYNYFASDRQSLIDAQYPLNFFLKDILEYLPDSQTTPASVSPAPKSSQRAQAACDSPQPDSARIPETAQPTYLTYVDKWNTMIPELPVGTLPSFALPLIETAMRDRDFAPAFDTVVAKCVKMAAAKQLDPSFTWLISKTKDGPIWQQVYMGKYDWAMKPKPGEGAPPMTAFERVKAKMQREAKEKQSA